MNKQTTLFSLRLASQEGLMSFIPQRIL